jgi:hypothetical protein
LFSGEPLPENWHQHLSTLRETTVQRILAPMTPAVGRVRLRVVFLTSLKRGNHMVEDWHRHHAPVQGHRFSLRVEDEQGNVHGGCSVGRPVARKSPQDWLEVTRLTTDGTENACSALYAAAARYAKEMDCPRIQTFILENEPGTSLKAAGWTFDGMSGGGDGWTSRKGRRRDQPEGPKQRWIKVLRGTSPATFKR